MIIGNILLSTFIIIIISALSSVLYIKINKKDFFGGLKTGIIVGISGGILGGFIFDLLFKITILQKLLHVPYVNYLLVNRFDINFVAIILGIWMFLICYDYVSEHTERS